MVFWFVYEHIYLCAGCKHVRAAHARPAAMPRSTWRRTGTLRRLPVEVLIDGTPSSKGTRK